MTDLRLVYSQDQGHADLVFDGSTLVSDDGLETAAIISLFSDRHAYSDDILPDNSGDRRGWWGDAIPSSTAPAASPDDRIGSRLWLLYREKQTESVRVRANEYAEECSDWIIEDGIAREVSVTSEWIYMGVLELIMSLARPPISAVNYRFALAWAAQARWGGVE